MDNERPRNPLAKTVLFCVVAGIAVGVACFFTFEVLGVEMSPAIVAGITGGVVGGLVPTRLSRKSK